VSRSILHMLSPLKHMSPFDVNMAVDAGFDAIIPHTNVALEDVRALVQDAMFSRPPNEGFRTSIFLAGRRAELGLDMLEAAKAAFVPPFKVNLLTDPAGAFTTGAALVAVVKKALREKHSTSLEGKRTVVFGGTGAVAYCASVIVAREGGRPVLCGYDGKERVTRIAADMRRRFDVAVDAHDGSTAAARDAAAKGADIVFSAGPAGVQLLTAHQIQAIENLLVAADVNAVPPLGLEGVAIDSNSTALSGKAIGIGALTVGNVKYKTEAGLFRTLLDAKKPISLEFFDAYRLADEIAG
jgi:methylene-tetrahydromethanopterin dehydrogenase